LLSMLRAHPIIVVNAARAPDHCCQCCARTRSLLSMLRAHSIIVVNAARALDWSLKDNETSAHVDDAPSGPSKASARVSLFTGFSWVHFGREWDLW